MRVSLNSKLFETDSQFNSINCQGIAFVPTAHRVLVGRVGGGANKLGAGKMCLAGEPSPMYSPKTVMPEPEPEPVEGIWDVDAWVNAWIIQLSVRV